MLADSATAKIIDGKGIAANLRGKVADAVHRLGRDRGVTPGLAVVLVGNNPASESYVGNKMKMTTGSGMRSFHHRLPATTTEAELLTLIGRLNADPTVHGILVQLPLPPDRPAKHHCRDRSGKGRRRLPSRERRTLVRGPAGAGAVHADRVRPSRQACGLRSPGSRLS